MAGGSRGGGSSGPTGPYRPAHAAWQPPLGRFRRIIREVGFDLITAGIVILLFVGYQLWGTGFAEASSQNKLKEQFNTATTVAPAGDASTIGPTDDAPPGPATGTSIAHMVIKKLGVDKYVVEGVSEAALREGPGHYPGTPMPGEPGNVAIAGHRTTYGAPFYNLDSLQPGDEILLTNKAGKQFHYTVSSSQVVKPSDVGVIGPTKDNRLTLTTCNPRFSATTRLVVVAMLTDAPVTPASTAAPPVIKAAAINLGAGTRSAWPPSIVYGLIALGLWTGFRVWSSTRRRRRWMPILVGIPLCLIPLWFLFENVIRLLPSNI